MESAKFTLTDFGAADRKEVLTLLGHPAWPMGRTAALSRLGRGFAVSGAAMMLLSRFAPRTPAPHRGRGRRRWIMAGGRSGRSLVYLLLPRSGKSCRITLLRRNAMTRRFLKGKRR